MSQKEIYRSSPIKRIRRSNIEMQSLLRDVLEIVNNEENQITIRHLFYRLVSIGSIEKTESAYKLLCGHLSKWRRSEEVPWNSFADNTRWHIKDERYDSIEEALNNTIRTYRRNLWLTQPYYVEVWVEKDAIASIVSDAAGAFGVPVFVCRGFASLSSIYSAAITFRERQNAGKQTIIYHLGDHDPSGVAAGEALKNSFRDDFNIDVDFCRLAVTPEQIRDLELPTRPTKTSDTRSRKWTGGDSVELDAIPSSEIQRIVDENITELIDGHAWNILRETEAMERETLKNMSFPRIENN